MDALPFTAQLINVFAAVLLLLSFAMLAQRRILSLVDLLAWQGAALVNRAYPPVKATIVETTAEHTAMLRQPEVQAVIADFLR